MNKQVLAGTERTTGKGADEMKSRKIERNIVYRGFRKDLEKRYGSEQAAEIWQYANREYQAIMAGEAVSDQMVRMFVFPAVALYRAIDHYAPGEALEVTRAYGTKVGRFVKKVFLCITSLPGAPALVWKNMDKLAETMSRGYECRNVVVNKNTCCMDIVRCPLYDKAKELGNPEATQMICCMDKEYMTGIRGLDYRRTKAVAEGHDCCDYRMKRTDLT